MNAIAARPSPLGLPLRFNWPRIGAWSGTLSLHFGILLLLLAPPVAMQALQRIDPPDRIFAHLVAPRQPIKEEEVKSLPVPKHKETPPRPRQHIVDNPAPRTLDHPADDPPGPVEPTHDRPAGPGDISAPGKDVAPTALAYAARTKVPYPGEALRRHERGTVILRVLVGADGLPQTIEIEKSSGSASLDRAAREAVKSWTFQAGTRNGVAQSAWARVPIAFDLTDL